MTLHLARLTLKRDPSTAALRALIDPAEQGRAMDAHHRPIWTAYAGLAGGSPSDRSAFLWRADGEGRFFVLSEHVPDVAPLFEPPEVKTLAPELAAGDRLSFALRVNATRSWKDPADPRVRGKRTDVVMKLLHAVPRGERAKVRMTLVQKAAEGWLSRQGERAGFVPRGVTVQDYSVMAMPGHIGRRRKQPQFGVLDLTGTLAVSDPATFVAALGRGFGHAKAFGCGLMMVRRA